MEEINLQELEELAQPLVELIRKKGSPYTKIVVEQDKVTLQECTIGVPLPYEN